MYKRRHFNINFGKRLATEIDCFTELNHGTFTNNSMQQQTPDVYQVRG